MRVATPTVPTNTRWRWNRTADHNKRLMWGDCSWNRFSRIPFLHPVIDQQNNLSKTHCKKSPKIASCALKIARHLRQMLIRVGMGLVFVNAERCSREMRLRSFRIFVQRAVLGIVSRIDPTRIASDTLFSCQMFGRSYLMLWCFSHCLKMPGVAQL